MSGKTGLFREQWQKQKVRTCANTVTSNCLPIYIIGNTQNNKTATKETYTHLHLTKDTIDYTSKTKDLSPLYCRTLSPGLSQFKLRQRIQQKEIFDSQTSQLLLQGLAQCVSLVSP